MKIENTSIEEVKVIIPKVFEDFRGYFFESFKSNEYSRILNFDLKIFTKLSTQSIKNHSLRLTAK